VTTTVTSQGVATTEFHCDCTTAASDEEEDRFAGRYWEAKSTAFCDDEDDNLFCVNGGSCADDPKLALWSSFYSY
jgi:hypothetical protein